MITSPIVRLLFFCFALVWAEICAASDLQLTVRFDRAAFEVGDKWKASLTYTNVASRSIRIVPDLPIYPASRFEIVKVDNGSRAQLILPGEIPSFDFRGLAGTAKLLRPRQSVERMIDADVATSLPDYYASKAKGLYLVFSGHALKLPGFGRYKITAFTESTQDGAVSEYAMELFGRPAIWSGKAYSAPVAVEFKRYVH